jgi:hypothetical protein
LDLRNVSLLVECVCELEPFRIGDALHPGSIAPIFKRAAQWIGMPARFVDEVSGHSTRVGAAQDVAELDIDLAAIT